MIAVVPASPLHVGPIANGARMMKTLAAGGRPRAELRHLMRQSVECWSALLEGHPIAMWGMIAPTLGTDGYVWLCLTDEVRPRIPVTIVRETRRFLGRMLETVHTLVGIVSVDDERALRFARFVGFEVLRDDGLQPIRAIRMTRDGC